MCIFFIYCGLIYGLGYHSGDTCDLFRVVIQGFHL